MRRVSASLILLFAGSSIWACSSTPANNEALADGDNGVGGTSVAAGTTQSTSTTASTATGTTNTNATSSTNNTVTGTSNTVSTVTGSTSTTGFGGASTGSGGANNATNTGAGGTSGGDTCVDVPPDDRETCETWAAWGECGNDWLADFCDLSCGRCTSQTSGNNNATSSGGASSTTTNSTSDTSNTSTTGSLGDDNPFGEVNGGQNGWASRYWDCCKPSCGWSANASNPVSSCDQSDNNIGVNDMRQNACTGGDSYTCHSMAPWAYSSQVSFGFAAVHANCGQCFHLQFTGTAANGGNGPGSQALAGKHMIVMATNIGDIQQGQFDLLIPGGGVGQFNGCSTQWGVDSSQLGPNYGGFLSECRNQDHNQTKTCMRNKCESIFGSRNLTELYDGCMWFVDWFEAADNPDFRYEEIQCPQELVDAAH